MISRNPTDREGKKGIPRRETHTSKGSETRQFRIKYGSREKPCAAVGERKRMMLVSDGEVTGEGV